MKEALPPPKFVKSSLLALALLASSCDNNDEAPIPVPDRILLVVTDATHAAHLSCYGDENGLTPAIDELASNGVRFSRAFSNNTWTLSSTASLFTGQLQEHHGAVTNHHRLDEGADTAAEFFEKAGWKTAAFVQMAYASAQFGFDQGFETFRYYSKGQDGRAGQTIPQALEWLNENRGEKWFVYLHLRRPHSPYKPTPPAITRLDEGCPLADGSRNEEFMFADSFGDRVLTEEERAHVEHLYQANLARTDTVLADVFELAKEQEAVIVVTSDHGEGLGEHGSFGHGTHLWAESIDIPLVFWWPTANPLEVRHPASTIDVLPTLLDIANLPSRDRMSMDGSSLYQRLLVRVALENKPVIASARYSLENHPRVAVIQNDWKLIRDPEGKVQLFNREEDPRDEIDRSAEQPELVSALSLVAAEWQVENRDVARSGVLHDGLDKELESDLEALGYFENDDSE